MELTKIKGINDKRAKELSKLGLFTTCDLIKFYPKNFLDLTKKTDISEWYHNDIVLTECKIVSVQQGFAYSKNRPIKAYLEQNGQPFTAVWFNSPYVLSKLKVGEYLFYGRVQNKYGSISLVNPTFEPLDKNYRLKGIIPVYPLKAGFPQKVIRDAIKIALKLENIESVIPLNLQKKYNLIDLRSAYLKLHCPQTLKDKNEGAERIALEEYFVLISAFKVIKGDKQEIRSQKYDISISDIEDFKKRFKFDFTNGQNSAVSEIFSKLTSPHKMNALLQGDVGSGKTAVAFCGVYTAVKSGYQACYLAPTEVLASQVYGLLKQYFNDYKVEILTGSTPLKEKKDIKNRLKNGEIDIICGTHAVIQEDVEFKNLAFCVCDEQHRFGVAQRSALLNKGASADVLVMSATPIPRTISLIFYGDLDIITIKDKPKDRLEISTSIIPQNKYDDMLSFVKKEAKFGRQTYFVCPKIEEDEEGSLASVTELFDEVKNRLPELRVALMHGKLKDKEKNQIMQDFKAKKYDALVSTTVIEVGVDAPSATNMIIYNAERFGLSQLHQLRGRVGRNSEKSYCFLLIGNSADNSIERLKLFKSTNDGFKIAEYDLEMRGGGDFLGTRQSGKFLNEIKNLKYSAECIFLAKKLSDEAFDGAYNIELLKTFAVNKYESLKDVVLN